MSRTKVLIVDDEVLARNRIKRFLADVDPNADVREADGGGSAVELIREFCPEIVFLDVQMPGLDGFEVLNQFENRDFQVIFQTAFDEHAIRAFEENACDYLLKPFPLERFQKAWSRAVERGSAVQGVQAVERSLRSQGRYLEKLVIRHAGKTKIVDVASVECFVSKDHYTCVYVQNAEFISELSLQWLEERLDPKQFVRCHRNNIVATKQFQLIGDTSESTVGLHNGMTLPVSRNRRKSILEYFVAR